MLHSFFSMQNIFSYIEKKCCVAAGSFFTSRILFCDMKSKNMSPSASPSRAPLRGAVLAHAMPVA
jgi:hypothetical protein